MEKHFPEHLLYTKDHEWCLIDGDTATVGITWHAQDQLGDIVYCELPEPGEKVSQGQTFGVVESVKAVSDLYSPINGEIIERNDAIVEAPEGLNDDTYDDGWMIRVKLTGDNDLDEMMKAEEYANFVSEEGT